MGRKFGGLRPLFGEGVGLHLTQSPWAEVGTQPLPQRGQSPTQFSGHVYCGQTAAWIKMPLDTEVGLGLRDIMFYVDPATLRKKHTHPHPILDHVYCGQMAGWIKTPLGTEVDLGSGHIVLGGVPATPPSFRPTSIVATVAHLSYC